LADYTFADFFGRNFERRQLQFCHPKAFKSVIFKYLPKNGHYVNIMAMDEKFIAFFDYLLN